MRQSLLAFLLNRYIISVIIALAIILLLPDYFSKYTLTLKSHETQVGRRVYFEDLNGDSKSEKITYYKNSVGNTCYMIHNANGDLLNQYNFYGNFTNTLYKYLWFLDANDNGYKEIYNITKRRDSVFLNINEPYIDDGVDIKDIFIDMVSPYNSVYEVFEGKTAHLICGGEGVKVVFTLNTGFAANPRHVYSYNTFSNAVKKSNHIVNKSTIKSVVNVDSDTSKEIILQTHSSDNAIDPRYSQRTDASGWLTILNSDLEFLFPPLEFEGISSSLKTEVVKKDAKTFLIVLYDSEQAVKRPDQLILYSSTLKEIKKVNLQSGLYLLFHDNKKQEIIVYNRNIGEVKIYDYNLTLIQSSQISSGGALCQEDIDNDGILEWLILYSNNSGFEVYRNDFSDVLKEKFSDLKPGGVSYGLKRMNKNESQLYFQKKDELYVYDYRENPLYPMQYLIYLGVYGLILSFVVLIEKGQNIRNKKQRAIETEIAELQLKTIKNQVDPHFVFNAINTISEMTLMENKLEIDRFIGRFSGFMRDTLRHSDKISTTLKDELDYVENFINLQRSRFSNAFNYTITVHDTVEKEFLVPKHVLFTYVENAIKHSLAFTKDGQLTIIAKKEKNNLVLIIEDNGTGLGSRLSIAIGTGNGLKIMEKLFVLYTKLYKRKIAHQIIDLATISEYTGLRVEIKIAL